MQWSPRQARYTLLLFLLLFTAGQARTHLLRDLYPDPAAVPGPWPAEGRLLDATALKNRALEVFPDGTTIAAALYRIGVKADPLGSGFCLPRAGVLYRGPSGWRVRPMTQRERWVWRIPMDLYSCTPGDLQRIDGIGPAMAERILSYVQEVGSLESLSSLLEVRGLGPGRMKQLAKELEIP